MRTSADRGRVYRRCGCRDADRRQFGARCPKLARDPAHGSWSFAVDVAAPAGQRTTVRRGGYASPESARAALRLLLEGEACGFDADPNQTVAEYLAGWLREKELVLKPTTFARYRDYVVGDLTPGLGSIRLDDLGHRQILAFVRRQLTAGRGKTTVYRCLATLSSALGDAVRRHRLPHNPARPPVLARPPARERVVWTAGETARFLKYAHAQDPLLADLCEVLIGTGMRKGEALGLHWNDVHFDERVLYVRYTLSAVNNSRLVMTEPKTRSSRNWIAISPRVADALRRRRASTAPQQRQATGTDLFSGLVFTRPDGRPCRPQALLARFRKLSAEAGVPLITLHDLRHLSATLAITAGVPLLVVSKTLRHSTLLTTANIYAHLTRPAAHGAVNAVQWLLTHTEQRPVPRVDHHDGWHPPTPPPRHPSWLQQLLAVFNDDPAATPLPHDGHPRRRGRPHRNLQPA